MQRVARILSETEAAEPLRGVRRAMAHNMAQAQAEVAAATIVDDADIEAWPPGADTTIRLIRALVNGCKRGARAQRLVRSLTPWRGAC